MFTEILEGMISSFIKLAIIAVVVVGAIAFTIGRCTAQVLLVSPQPTLAPHDCPCKPECKCDPCVCKTQTKPIVSVKKYYTPTEASVTVRASKGKEVFQASGTAIDEHTAISCWHVTRGDGWTYTVNGKPATLLRSDSKSDLALFTTVDQLKPVKVAEKPLATGEACHAYGYEWDRKGVLYRWRTWLTRRNRYQGFDNQSIAGTPKSGRSGGGLFNEQGELVGVCSAADGTEGLYAGHAAIKAIIDPTIRKPLTVDPIKKTPPKFQSTIDPLKYSAPDFNVCPNGQCLPGKGKPAPPLIVAPRQQAISGPVFNNCPSGQCFQAPAAPKATGSREPVAPTLPARGFYITRRWGRR